MKIIKRVGWILFMTNIMHKKLSTVNQVGKRGMCEELMGA